MLSARTFSFLAGIVFLVVALAHLCRALMGWSLVVNGWSIPIWASVVAAVFAGFLSFEGLRGRAS
jgi:hypothetical protein